MGATALNRHDYERALRFLREGLERSKVAAVKLWILNVLAGVIGTNAARPESAQPMAPGP